MGNIWDDGEQVSEYELMAEDAEKAEKLAEEYDAQPSVVEASEEALEEIAEEAAFDLDHKESNVIYNARLRLEQAKLYEMLINHNLFDGVDASPDAIKNVENELKFYIVKRLEILLGLREPTVRVESVSANLPFNDVEIDFLKQLAYKGTLGASINGKPLAPTVQKQQGLRSIGSPKATTTGSIKSLATKPKPRVENKVVETPPVKKAAPAQPPKKVVASPPAPKQAAKPQPKAPVKASVEVRPTGLGRNMTEAEAIAIAKADLKASSNKPFHEMSAKEKAEKIRQVNEKHKRPTAIKGAAPMPTSNELEMKYMNQQSSRAYSKNQTDQFNLVLANALASQKNNRGDDNE